MTICFGWMWNMNLSQLALTEKIDKFSHFFQPNFSNFFKNRRSLRNTSATTNGNTKQPKMGVPMMTSTPARSLKTADYISSSAGM